ncbi:MAG: nitroreductase family protein [Cyclobacteriaceae bacterium]
MATDDSQMSHGHIPYKRDTYSANEMIQRSRSFYEWLDGRRTVRHFSDKPVPREVMENIIMAASTAPSGANKQPGSVCLIGDKEVKKAIREAAEKEESEHYQGRMSDRWLKDLEKFETDWHKPFLEKAPWLLVVCKRAYEIGEEGEKVNNYYVNESVGLAGGMLIAAIHNAGLISLTHTPSPMNFLTKILKRPDNERPFLLIPVGYPAEDAMVPDIDRKSFEEVAVII